MKLYKALLSIALLSIASFGRAANADRDLIGAHEDVKARPDRTDVGGGSGAGGGTAASPSSTEPFELSKNALPGDGGAPKKVGSEHPHPRDHLDTHHHINDAADETGRLLLRGNAGGDTKDDVDIAALSERRLQSCTCTDGSFSGACGLCSNDGTDIECPDPLILVQQILNAGRGATIDECNSANFTDDFAGDSATIWNTTTVTCDGTSSSYVCAFATFQVPDGGTVDCLGAPGINFLAQACADANVNFLGGGVLTCENKACATGVGFGSDGGSVSVPVGGSLSCTFNDVEQGCLSGDGNGLVGSLDLIAGTDAGEVITCTAYVTPDCTPPASTKSSKGPKGAKSKSPKMTKSPKRGKMSY